MSEERRFVLKKLKKLSVRRALLFPVLSFLLLAVLLVAITGFSSIKAFNGPVDIAQLDRSSLHSSYVSMDNYYVYGSTYETYEEDSSGVQSNRHYYYLLWVYTQDDDNGFYTHIRVPAAKAKYLDALMNKQAAYFDELSEGGSPRWPECETLTGTVKKADDEIAKFTKELLAEIDEDDYYIEQEPVNYYVDYDSCGTMSQEAVMILTYISGACAIVALLSFLKAISGGYLKPLKRYVRKNLDNDWQSLAADFESAVQIERCFITKQYIYYMKNSGPKPKMQRLADVAWAYKYTQIVNGASTSWLVFRTESDKKKLNYVSVNKERNIKAALEKLLAEQPHIVIGFSDRLELLFKTDIDGFKAIAEKQRSVEQPDTAAAPISLDEAAIDERDAAE